MNLANKYQDSDLDTRCSARLSQLLSSKTLQPVHTSQSEFEVSLQATFDAQMKVEDICLKSSR